jgi:uncharacterized protein (UPF0335 family)
MGVASEKRMASVNGSPPMPLGDAVKLVKARFARNLAAVDPEQVDLEEATGVAPRQQQREAEAGGIAADRLRSVVERVERLEEERRALAKDVKDVLAEAKSAGFGVPTVRRIVKLRRMEPAAVEEQDTLLDLYRRALGM